MSLPILAYIKVLLADDHSIVLEGLQMILSDAKNIKVVGTAKNGEDVLSFLTTNEVDVIVMDINMPYMDGLTCSRTIKKKGTERQLCF